ncbi:hypothetical protein TNCV_3227661 [Trichonephila clavipes]|nr:hypothetical protein TNCV_3227661 [Trichonephila clavipes]
MNPELNLDIQLATRTGPLYEQLPEGNEMEQSSPPSDSSTRPGTPQLTNCERMKAVTYDLRQSAVLIELQETAISTLPIQGLNDDAVMTTLLERLTDLQVKHQIAVRNAYPLQLFSPSKSVQEYPPLPKTTAVKRKEKEGGFSSPPTRKLSKNKRTNSNPDLNFNPLTGHLPPEKTWEVERGKFYDPVRSLLKSKNQESNRLQLAVKLPWAIFFESVDILLINPL